MHAERHTNLRDIIAPEWSARPKIPEREHVQERIPDLILEHVETLGCSVRGVALGSPAEEAGLQSGDLIVGIDDTPFSTTDLSAIVQLRDGTPCALTIVRDEKRIAIKIQPRWNTSLQRWTLGLSFDHKRSQIDATPIFEMKDNEIVTVEFPLAEAEGHTVRTRITFGPSTMVRGEQSRPILSFVCMTEKGPYDILARFNEEHFPIYWTPGLDALGSCCYTDKVIKLQSPFLGSTPQTIVHELQHARQAKQEKFTRLLKFYRSITREHTAVINSNKALTLLRQSLETSLDLTTLPEECARFFAETSALLPQYRIAKRDLGFAKEQLAELRNARPRVYAEKMRTRIGRPIWQSLAERFAQEPSPNEMRHTLIDCSAFTAEGPIHANTAPRIVEETWWRLRSAFFVEQDEAPLFDWQNATHDANTGLLTLQYGEIGMRIPTISGFETSFADAQQSVDEYEIDLHATVSHLQTEYDGLNAKIPREGTRVIDELTVRDILHLPTMLIERDAEYAGLVGLRVMKKEVGLNFYAPSISLVAKDSASQEKPGILVALRAMTPALHRIQNYMQSIGVPNGCVQETKRRLRKKHGDYTDAPPANHTKRQ